MSSDDEPKTYPALLYRLITTHDSIKTVLFFVVLWVVTFTPVIIAKIASDPAAVFSSRNCLDLKEVAGKVYKIDQCARTIEPFKPEN